jgi:periplasmic protein CpxP/Spy
MQNTNKFLKIAVLLLLAANIALVAFMVWGRPKKNTRTGRPDPTEMLAKELGLSDEQKITHRQMKEEHMKSIKGLMDSIRDAKVGFYTLNKEAQLNDSLLTVYGSRVSALQIKVDKAMLAHFKRVRAFLKPEQQLKYDTLVIKMINRGRRDSATKNK